MLCIKGHQSYAVLHERNSCCVCRQKDATKMTPPQHNTKYHLTVSGQCCHMLQKNSNINYQTFPPGDRWCTLPTNYGCND